MPAAQEAERVMETFEKHLRLPVTKIDDADRTLALLRVRIVARNAWPTP
jgi:hypothetical protein